MSLTNHNPLVPLIYYKNITHKISKHLNTRYIWQPDIKPNARRHNIAINRHLKFGKNLKVQARISPLDASLISEWHGTVKVRG
jgi:hypothetical protein